MFANKHAKILIALVCAVLGFMLALSLIHI